VAKFVTIQGCCAVLPTTETKTYDATDKKTRFCKAIHRENNIFSSFSIHRVQNEIKATELKGLLQQNELMFRKNTLYDDMLLRQSTGSK